MQTIAIGPILMIVSALMHVRRISSVSSLKFAVGGTIPTGIMVDIVKFSPTAEAQKTCQMQDLQDFGSIVRTHRRAVIFAVPGAFTPTCSLTHLPGFITNMPLLRSKDVDAVYCLSVNDKFVMRAWAEATAGAAESGIQFIADGSGLLTKALDMELDRVSFGLGVRSMRYAAVIEHGSVRHLFVDDKGLNVSSAENILATL